MTTTADADVTLDVRQRHPLIGAEVHGLDLGQPLNATMFRRLHALWMQHLLLIFPGQHITDEQHIAFGRNFDALEIHPSLAHRSSRNAEICGDLSRLECG